MIALTEGQTEGKTLAEFVATQRRVGCIAGYAGTGKTTLIGEILKTVGSSILLCPTGKAAARLSDVSGFRASTIHMWLYDTKDANGRPIFQRKEIEKIALPASGLVIIDEASMLSKQLFDDVYDVVQELNLGLLLVGDAFQLPPVQNPNDPPFSVFESLDFKGLRVDLTEILRQAAESPTIRLCTQIRSGDVFDALADATHILSEDLIASAASILEDGGAVLCYTNAMRQALNLKLRERMGFSGDLCPGEPLIVNRNNYVVDYFNGEVFQLNSIGDLLVKRSVSVNEDKMVELEFYSCLVGGKDVILCPAVIMGRHPNVQTRKIEKALGYYLDRGYTYLDCSLGYVLTCHKAQGSEWDRVIVVLERQLRVNTDNGRRWLYTATSRSRSGVKFCSTN